MERSMFSDPRRVNIVVGRNRHHCFIEDHDIESNIYYRDYPQMWREFLTRAKQNPVWHCLNSIEAMDTLLEIYPEFFGEEDELRVYRVQDDKAVVIMDYKSLKVVRFELGLEFR